MREIRDHKDHTQQTHHKQPIIQLTALIIYLALVNVNVCEQCCNYLFVLIYSFIHGLIRTLHAFIHKAKSN